MKCGLFIHHIQLSSLCLAPVSKVQTYQYSLWGEISALLSTVTTSPRASAQFTIRPAAAPWVIWKKSSAELRVLMTAVLIQKYLRYTTALNESSRIDLRLRPFALLTAPVSSNWRDLSLLSSRGSEAQTARINTGTDITARINLKLWLSSSAGHRTHRTPGSMKVRRTHQKFRSVSGVKSIYGGISFPFPALLYVCKDCIQDISAFKAVLQDSVGVLQDRFKGHPMFSGILRIF